ncbi:MAG TPA: hypothetical protein [Caudoviricetes sp.]|nr:MAG TPA: hypothetical protein [Caudoviricetes sp.]
MLTNFQTLCGVPLFRPPNPLSPKVLLHAANPEPDLFDS